MKRLPVGLRFSALFLAAVVIVACAWFKLRDRSARPRSWPAYRQGPEAPRTVPYERASYSNIHTNSTPVTVAGLGHVVCVAVGDGSGFAVRSDGTVWGWGVNRKGQLGDGTTTDHYVPVRVRGLFNAVSLMAADDRTIALCRDGSVWSWGAAGFSGDQPAYQGRCLTPLRVPGVDAATAISLSVSNGLALVKDGTVRAWGAGEHGQLGRGCRGTSNSARPVPGLRDIIAVAAGGGLRADRQHP